MKGTLWVDDLTGDVVRAQLDDPTTSLLSEIHNPELRQPDVAQTIALLLRWGQRDAVDWGAVSAAASERWSRSGWRRVKSLAWSGRCWPEHD
jgi:hypothetical protein